MANITYSCHVCCYMLFATASAPHLESGINVYNCVHSALMILGMIWLL